MRKEITVTIRDRETPLQFKIKEMPATRLESWLMRAVLLLAQGGLLETEETPDLEKAAEYLQNNLPRALAGMDYATAKPLLDELLACCSRVADSGVEMACTPETVDGYVEDVTTLLKLRLEALKLNLGFLRAAGESGSSSPVKLDIGKPRRARA